MAWYDEAVFYHIYPLGMTGAPKQNSYSLDEHRLQTLVPWISHLKKIGVNAIYIGPLFESVGHGYETTDYKKLDSRLGDNQDLKEFVAKCHKEGIRVIFDGVFNHTGRDFFAFKDLQKNREQSHYKDWYCNVNFGGNNEYNDGFSYENWGGYNLLVKLNQRNPEVKDYIADVIRFWVDEFDVDGIRLDAADVLDFDFMKSLRHVANTVKPDFWLMGEVIHGDYNRWVNEGTLHSVTNYQLHKALYSGNNDHNFFEIAHTVKRLYEMGGNRPDGLKLYNFVDNHDVERIYTKLNNKAHYNPVHVLLYTLPGVPSIYYGSEFGIEGKKEKQSDDSLRPALQYADYENAVEENPCTRLIAALGKARNQIKALSYGDYRELQLQNRYYAYSRNWEGHCAVITVNNDDNGTSMNLPVDVEGTYIGVLSGTQVQSNNHRIAVQVSGNSGEIWVPIGDFDPSMQCEQRKIAIENTNQATKETSNQTEVQSEEKNKIEEPVSNVESKQETDVKKPEIKPETSTQKPNPVPAAKEEVGSQAEKDAFERGKIAGLQEAIIAIMEKNGPVTEQMRKDVTDNVYYDSLINWVKSFR